MNRITLSDPRFQHLYTQACRLDPRNAEALFQYASHTDSILIAQETDEGVPIGFGETVREVLKVYIKATQVGAQHLHHCMPRIISLWLDFSANLQTVSYTHLTLPTKRIV